MSSANNELLYGPLVWLGRTLSHASAATRSVLRLATHSRTPDRKQVTVPVKTPDTGHCSGWNKRNQVWRGRFGWTCCNVSGWARESLIYSKLISRFNKFIMFGGIARQVANPNSRTLFAATE